MKRSSQNGPAARSARVRDCARSRERVGIELSTLIARRGQRVNPRLGLPRLGIDDPASNNPDRGIRLHPRNQAGQPRLGQDRVTIQEDDILPPGTLDSKVSGHGRPDVGLQANEPDPADSRQSLGRPVGRSIVDDHHLGAEPRLVPQVVQALEDVSETVPTDNNDAYIN